MRHLPAPRACLTPAVLLLVLAACTAQQTGSPAGETSSAVPTMVTTATPTPSATSSRSSTPTPSPSPSPAAVRRTSAELKGALLSLKDLPAGFEIDRSGGDDGTRMSSTTRSCAPLVRLMNSAGPQGSRAQAGRSFSGGQDGPYVDESLDAMGTPQAARAFVDTYRGAVKGCRTIKVRIPGVGSSLVDVREISFGTLGGDTFAARFRARRGPLEGFEIIQAGVQSGDVVLGTTVVGLDGTDAEAATDDAVQKAAKKLGTSGSI